MGHCGLPLPAPALLRYIARMASHPFTPQTVEALRAALHTFPRRAIDDAGSARRAAVAIVLSAGQGGDAAFLLTIRAATLRSHGGQYALPGGRLDPGETAIEAAIRECAEELGLVLEAGDVLGVLDDYATRSGYVITPVVLATHQHQRIMPNPDEVAEVVSISLADITGPEKVEFETIPESDRPVVRLLMNGDWVHAPTAAMIYQFAELVAGRVTRVAHLEQPVFAWR